MDKDEGYKKEEEQDRSVPRGTEKAWMCVYQDNPTCTLRRKARIF